MGIGTNRLGLGKWGLLSGLLGLVVALGCQAVDYAPQIDNTSVDVATQYVADNEAEFNRSFLRSILLSETVPEHISPEWFQLYLVGETNWEFSRVGDPGFAGSERVVASVSAIFEDDKVNIDVLMSFDISVDPADRRVISAELSSLNDVNTNYAYIDVTATQ